jgi:hypothetical protein
MDSEGVLRRSGGGWRRLELAAVADSGRVICVLGSLRFCTNTLKFRTSQM